MTINQFRRPLWIVPLAIAVLVAAFGWWGEVRLRETIEDQLTAELNTTLDANLTALDIWTANQAKLATALAEEPELKSLTLRILERFDQAGGSAGTRLDPPEAARLDACLSPRLAELGYGIANLVSTNMIVVTSSTRGSSRRTYPVYEEHLAKFSELFASGNPVIITPFKPRRPMITGVRRGREVEFPQPSAPAFRPRETETNGLPGADRARLAELDRIRHGDITLMQVAVPVRDTNAVVRGALALIINPDLEFTRILSVARRGSGETYAFDQRGLMISRSRFDFQLKQLGLIEDRPEATSALNLRLSDPGSDSPDRILPEDLTTAKRPLMHLITNAVAGGSGIDVSPSRDYRGVTVVGAWRWLPQLDFGVATQMDASEAYRPLRMLELLFLSLFLLLLLCAIGMFLISLLNVIWVRRLGEAELKLKNLGQYTLEEKIGEGGMGVVYRARHALMRRDTAVKLLLPDRADPAAIQRFQNEVRLACQLTHPNTIQVYDYGHTPDGIFYYAMEFLNGLNLLDLVARYGPLPEGRVIHVLAQVCESLAEAHALGLVHRDIKPANVFLCDRIGMPDCVKLLDFGLVRDYRQSSGDATSTIREQGVLGTPAFVSPEAIRDAGRCDPRSDVYSVGALGYYLLTGQCVFTATSLAELCDKHLSETPIAPSRRTTNPISVGLDRVILRCLEKDPALRPQSADELRALLATTPHATGWGTEARTQWWARHRTEPPPNRSEPGRAPDALAHATTETDVAGNI